MVIFLDIKKIVFILIYLILFFIFYKEFQKDLIIAEVNFGNEEIALWSASNAWLESADCFKKTKVFLALCRDDSISPISKYSAADDIGHSLIVEIIHVFFNLKLKISLIPKINIVINFVGMVLLQIYFSLRKQYLLTVLFLFFSLGGFLHFSDDGPHWSFVGVVAFGILGLLLLNSVFKFNENSNTNSLRNVSKLSIKLILGIFFLGLAILIREPIGRILLAVGLVVSFFIQFNWKRRILYSVVLLLIFNSSTMILRTRDFLFNLDKTNTIETHGTSHNLFLGLGAVPNSFGIEWDDSYAARRASEINPKVGYVTHEYYGILKDLYIETVLSDPWEVYRIYKEKFFIMLDYHIPVNLIVKNGFFIFSGLPVFLLLWYFRYKKKFNTLQEFEIFMICYILHLLFYVQGILSHHMMMYAYPMGIVNCILLALYISLAFKFIFLKWKPKKLSFIIS